MKGARRIAGGNLVTAFRSAVEGTDYHHTGEVRPHSDRKVLAAFERSTALLAAGLLADLRGNCL